MNHSGLPQTLIRIMQLIFAGKHKVFIQNIQYSHKSMGIITNVLRLDEIHPIISGNKFFKLQLYIKDAINKQFSTIATFGGAYSNHIIATACYCNQLGIGCVGIIRGEEPAVKSDTLLQAEAFGMKLIYVTREVFKDKTKIIENYNTGNYYWVNEGGYGRLGAEGAADICSWMDDSYTDIVCAVGTGTMMAGLVIGAMPHQKVTGISILKGNNKLIDSVTDLLMDEELNKNFELIDGYHFGGYAKHPEALLDWMNLFYTQHKIPTDLVYTAKLCFAVNDLLQKGYFAPNSKIMMVHSGGLQGNNSLFEGRLIF